MSTWRPTGGGSDDANVPRRIGETLGRVTRGLGGPDAELLGIVFTKWSATVGAAISDHAAPVALRDEVLTVEVREPAWATQLRFLETDILSRLEEAAGRPVASRIEVRVSGSGRGRRRG